MAKIQIRGIPKPRNKKKALGLNKVDVFIVLQLVHGLGVKLWKLHLYVQE